MPSSITHDYFCKDVYNKIKIKDKIILNDFCSFGEGPDPYFFYNFHLTNKAKNVHKINTKIDTHPFLRAPPFATRDAMSSVTKYSPPIPIPQKKRWCRILFPSRKPPK